MKITEGGGSSLIGSVKIPSKKLLKTFPGPVRSFIVKENQRLARSFVTDKKKLTTFYGNIGTIIKLSF